ALHLAHGAGEVVLIAQETLEAHLRERLGARLVLTAPVRGRPGGLRLPAPKVRRTADAREGGRPAPDLPGLIVLAALDPHAVVHDHSAHVFVFEMLEVALQLALPEEI